MLADLFKPAWKSSSVEKRLKAVSEMDSENPERQKILTQLVTDDEDVSICLAAIHKIISAAALHEVSLKHANDTVRLAAEKKVNALLSVKNSLNEDQYRDFLARYPALKIRIAAHADSAAVRTEAIPDLSSSELLEVLGETVYTDSRQLIVERLTNIEELEAARKILRKKDKNAERLLKSKIDAVRKQQRQHAENLTTVEKLTEEIEYLASHDWRAEFKARLQVQRKRWDELDFDIEPESNQRYQAARQIIEARFEELSLIEQAQQSQQQLLTEIEAFLRNLAGRDLTNAIDAQPGMRTKLDAFSSSWQQLSETIQPDPAMQNKKDSMLSAMQSASRLTTQAADILQQDKMTESDEAEPASETSAADPLVKNSQKLNAALKQLNWPAAYGELQCATDLQAQLADWRSIQKTAADDEKQKLDLVHKKISSIFRFSRAGNLARAKQFCERVEKALDQFEGTERVNIEERFAEARKTLGDMGDWKNFATEPKYIELCEAIELLVGSSLHPDKLSDEIKALQQSWKKLGHSDISEQYWPRFKEAADKAYQPCAEFFDKRRKVRQSNLEQRQQHVEQMQKLLDETDWDNDTDYKAVQASARSIIDDVTGIKDVEQGAGQKQWKQFSKFKDEVFAKLDVVYEANIKLKRDLIEQTVALAEADAKVENLAKLKTLQTSWKQVGITRRKDDQKAWTEFKKQGDLVYDKVQQLRQGNREETDQQINAYRDIIKDIQKLASTAKNLVEADQLFAALQAKYAELPELQLPEKDEHESAGHDSYRPDSQRPDSRRPQAPGQLPEKVAVSIQRDYLKACDQFDECHSRIIDSKHSQQIDALRLKANLCALQEALGQSPTEEQLQEISQQWDAIELHDSVMSRRIEKRRASAQTAIDRVAIGAERRMLCIQLEIATGSESPAEDKALRMQYQLEQMNQSGLGQDTENSAEHLEKMEIDWLCMPGAELEQQKELDARWKRALGSK